MSAEVWLSIAVAALTFVLVCVTAFYAWQTKRTVSEMKLQRDQMSAQVAEMRVQRKEANEREAAQRRQAIRGVRHAVVSELRQIVASIEGKRGYARLYMWMPSSAWRSSFERPEAFPDDVRGTLFVVYDEVERMNAAVRIMMLAKVQTERDPRSALFIRESDERWTRPDFMLRDIRPLIERIESLPEPA